MKLVIQIPAYNEETTIATVLKSLPKQIDKINEVVFLVIDDGSSDKTFELSKQYADEAIKLSRNYGLSVAFMTGLNRAIELGADILVNIDADNQYSTDDIEKLIRPILDKRADIVVGSRNISGIGEFSFLKKVLQKIGTFVVKHLSQIIIDDAPSGFRAYSREAVLKLNIFNYFSHTIETLIQAKEKNLVVENVQISVNPQKNRKSRLSKNMLDYIFKQTKTMLRFYVIYKPQKFFFSIANTLLFFGLMLGLRFLYYFFYVSGVGHIQSLILCAILLILSFLCYMLAFIGDLFSINRKILENIQYEIRKEKYKK